MILEVECVLSLKYLHIYFTVQSQGWVKKLPQEIKPKVERVTVANQPKCGGKDPFEAMNVGEGCKLIVVEILPSD